MVLSDKRVLWHPRNHNKFVVGGSSQITLYEWAAEYPEIRHVTSQHDLHHMKCFAWSPDPAFEDLVAVGLSTGRVDLLRLEASKHARKHNILSSGPTVNLPVRTSRSCNALAFSQKDPNYLAVGLDKIRNDPSLVIWDISSARPTLAIASLDAGLDTAALANHPNSRPQPQIPRTDSRADSRIIQQHALTETVSAVSFLPDTSHVLLAGVSQRWLRMFDLRSATPAVTNVASKVQEIATDPFDCHRVACFGDSTVTVWDQRKFGQPLLQFSEKDASADGARIRPNATFIHVEFSAARRNCLATLERDASYVRFWDISETRGVMDGNVFGGSFEQDGRQPREALRGSRRSWANLPWPTAQTQPTNAAPASTPPTERTVQVLTDTRRTKIFPRSLSSFAVVPNTNDSQPLATSVMVVNKEGDLEMYQVHDTPKQALWSSRGEFALGSGTGFKFISGYRDEDDFFEDHPSDIRQPSALPTPYSQFEMGSRSRSAPRRDDLSRRGRAPKNEGIPPGSALFSRDEDSVVPSGVAAQLARNVNDSRKRGYSPSSLRKYATKGGEGDPPLKDFLVSDANASRSRDRTHSPANRKQRDDPLRTARPADSRMPSPGPGSKRKPPNVRHGKQKGISHVIEEDISMVMRKRALKGYCLSKPFDNSTITHEEEDAARSHDDSLSEAWAWLHHSRDVLCTPSPKIHGFDFSFQGLLGLFEGFAPIALPEGQSVDDTPIATQRTLLDVPGGPHPFTPTSALLERQASRRSYSPADDLYGNWNAAITTLVERRGADKSTWKPSAPTMKLSQRHLGLELCGWSLRDEELKAAVKRWEKEGQISRAACWLVFMKQYSKAMDLLYKSNDEKHRMMSGTIAALTPHGSSPLKNPELREHYSRLSVRLQDPYFRMMIIHMGVGDWLEVLEEDVIPFRERLAIAFQFLDDRSLKSYLQRIGADASQTGNIDAIIVTGLTKQGLDVLQAYVDRTGDVQTTAIMGSYVCPVKFQDRRVDRWLNAYRDMLDGFRLHAERVGFDIERGQLVLDALQNGEGIALSKDLVPPQILIRCHYCNKPVNTTEITGVGPNKARPTTCPNCSRPLPKCSVCLMTLAIIDDATRELDLGYGSYKDTLDDAIVICQTCRHGGHASHILEWFLGEDGRQAHGMCPVAGCDCRCADDL